MTLLTALIASAALALPAGGALAGDPPEEAPVLGGPEIDEGATRETLVRRGYDGALEPLEAPPEVAALDLFDLDAETREKIDEILADRAAVIDGVVVRNVRTLVELQGATAAGDTAAQRRYLATLVDQFEPLRKSGRLVDKLAAAMPEADRREYRRLVRERHTARFEEIKAELENAGLEDVNAVAFKRMIAEAIGLEIKASYDRIVASGTAQLEETIAALRLDPETEGEVRRLVTEFGQRTMLNPTPEQRRELFAQIYKVLPPDARRRLVDWYRDGAGG